MLMEKERRSIYDHIRAISCIGIIGLHVTGDRSDVLGLAFESFFRLWLPMFFLLSGLLILTSAKEESTGRFYLKRFEKVVIPFIIYGMYYTCWINQGHRILELPDMESLKAAVKLIPDALRLNFMGSQYFHLWFLYAIIGIYILMPFLKKGLRAMDDKMLVWLAAVILIMQACQDYLPAMGILFGTENHFNNWLIYIIFGYIMAQEFAKKHYKKFAAVGAVVFIGAFLFRVFFYDYTCDNYYDLSPHMILQVLGAFAVFMLLEKALTRFKALNWIMAKISRYSFSVYLIHGYIISWWGVHKGTSNGTVYGTLHTTFWVFVLSLIFAVVFDNVIIFNVQRLFRFLVRKIDERRERSVQV